MNNLNQAQVENLFLDWSSPWSTVESIGTSNIYQAAFPIAWRGSDAGSGIKQYRVEVSDNGGAWNLFYLGTERSKVFTGQHSHTYAFRAQAQDNAGNWEPVHSGIDTQVQVILDNEPPKGSVIINNGDLYTRSSNVILGLLATDNIGVTSTQLVSFNQVLNDWNWLTPEPYKTSRSYTFQPGQGWKTAWARFYDAAGNISEWANDNILYDSLAPAVQVYSPMESHTRTFDVFWLGTDDYYGGRDLGQEYFYHDVPGKALDVFAAGSYAFVAAGDAGLRILNASNPYYPGEVGYVKLNQALDVVVEGDYAYVADGVDGLRIINVSNPSAPSLVGTYNPSGWVEGVKIRWPYAFLAAGSSGLLVVNISVPNSPVLSGSYSISGANFKDVAFYNNYVLVADNSSIFQQKSLRIINADNPSAPYQASSYMSYALGSYGYPRSISTNGSTGLFVTDTGVLLIDLANPLNPIYLNRYTPPSYIAEATSVDHYMVVPHDFGISVVDIADPANPVWISKVDTSGESSGATFFDHASVGRMLYVADGEGGLQIIDANSLEYPFLATGNYDTVSSYDVRVRELPDGTAQPWKTGTQDTFSAFTGENGKEYCFSVQTHDKAGNTGDSFYTFACTTIKTPEVVLESYTIDDDQNGDSYGNGNGTTNPGEFVELHLTLGNPGFSEAQNLEINISTNDSCVLNDGIFFYDQGLSFGSIPAGESRTSDGSSNMDLDFGISSGCPSGHQITFNLEVRENIERGNTWTIPLHVSIEGSDTTEPQFIFPDVTPKGLNPGEPLLITVFVRDPAPYQAVAAIDEESQPYASIVLSDSGTGGDAAAGDHWYSALMALDRQGDFSVRFEGMDDFGNTAQTAELVHFTTKPFVASQSLLLVYDRWDYGVVASEHLPFYSDGLQSLGYTFDVWNTTYRGPVPAEVLASYANGAVIWAMPTVGYLGYIDLQQQALQNYLDLGGHLLLTGQDVGYYLTGYGQQSNAFYEEYLHAGFIQDNSGMNLLSGVGGDPISNGQTIQLNGGDSAHNQEWPSVISPLAPAVPIYRYTGSSPRVAGVLAVAEDDQAARQVAEFIPSPHKPLAFTPPQTKPELQSSAIDPVAGLRVDNGVYKIVYLAFGIEGVNDEQGANRAEILSNSLNWLLPNHAPVAPFAPFPGEWPKQSEVSQASLPILNPGEVVLWWQGLDIDPGDVLRYDVLPWYNT